MKKLNDNANPAADSTSGLAPVRVRARSNGTNHLMRALPQAEGVSEICVTQPLGGELQPAVLAVRAELRANV